MINNVAMKVTVEGTDVMGACVEPTLASSLDSCTAEMMVTVSSSDCTYPVIVIVDQAPAFTSPRIIQRSEQLDIRALIDISCGTTLLNTKVGPPFCILCYWAFLYIDVAVALRTFLHTRHNVVLESEFEYSKVLLLRLSEQKSTKINRLIDQSVNQ